MANIFDYLKDVAYDSYYDLPLNELDILTLIEITYLSFDNLVSTLPQRLLDLAPQVPRDPTMLTSKNRLQLLDELAQHKRFKNCKLSHFINDIDPELQKQFAAMTYRVSLDTYLIVFRGTDDSIIGWKEDFHLTYMKEIPAQKHALRYLKNFFAHHPKQKVILAGHSKGGNLAIYAASQIEQSLQNQITAVYTFDAPGLHQELTQTAGYQRIMDRSKILDLFGNCKKCYTIFMETVYDKAQKLNSKNFKLLIGVKKETFQLMLEHLNSAYQIQHRKGGRPRSLPMEDQLIMTLRYLRYYPTQRLLAFDFGVGVATVNAIITWVEDTLRASGSFDLDHLEAPSAAVAIDVTESPIQRPKKTKAKIILVKRNDTP
ncbi:lipase [Streptococcus pneumoniae]|nr:lipase [Streptococcus pneumoniae]VNX95833.1 lipase [Streptococcus pneumoniae]